MLLLKGKAGLLLREGKAGLLLRKGKAELLLWKGKAGLLLWRGLRGDSIADDLSSKYNVALSVRDMKNVLRGFFLSSPF